MDVLSYIFGLTLIVPSIWFAFRFFRQEKQERLQHQDQVNQIRRRKHWQRDWRSRRPDF